MSTAQYPPEYFEQNKGHAPFGLAIAFIIIETFCVALRFWARWIGHTPWGADDILIIPGFVLCIAVYAYTITDVIYGGIGHHEAALAMTDPGKIIIWAKFIIVVPLLYLAAVVFPKLAILAIYLRIFIQRPFRIACYVLGGVLIANWIGTTIVGLLICVPLSFLWNRTIPGGYCLDINAWFRWSSLINIITDVAMLILPLPMIWKLHTSRNVKIGLTFTFATGSLGLVTSVIRFASFFTENAQVDGTYSASDLFVWTVCESGMYLVAACLPTYRPLARTMWSQRVVSWLHSISKTSRLLSLSKGPTHSQSPSNTVVSSFPLDVGQASSFERIGNVDGSLCKSDDTVSCIERGDVPMA